MADDQQNADTLASQHHPPSLRHCLQRWRWLRRKVNEYADEHAFTLPLWREELNHHTQRLTARLDLAEAERRLAALILHNSIWRSTVATVPFNRRVLLLPQCLRTRDVCLVTTAESGLPGEECRHYSLERLQHEAECMGYEVLVAEETAPAERLVRGGEPDAFIRVDCLENLEESFPSVVPDAVPALGIPLLNERGSKTTLDAAWLMNFLHLRSVERPYQRIPIDHLREKVEKWFSSHAVRTIMGEPDNATARMAREWLTKSGKRWRPLLTAAVFDALAGNGAHQVPASLQKAALATECFHKASLIHDDIEDNDNTRYGEETLHRQHGVSIALNTGDFLIGEGYRLICECDDLAPIEKNRMLAAVSSAHRNLCIGQGEELNWRNDPVPLSIQSVLDIFRLKTAPIFEIALRAGAICAGMEENLCPTLSNFSEHLGIAYQITDDIQDFENDTGTSDVLRPSLLLALLWEESDEDTRDRIQQALSTNAPQNVLPQSTPQAEIQRADTQARDLLAFHRNKALNALQPLNSRSLKRLLTCVVHRIVSQI